jgi:hypothetical protein
MALLNTAAYIGINGDHFLFFYPLNGIVVYIGATVRSDPLFPAQQCEKNLCPYFTLKKQ